MKRVVFLVAALFFCTSSVFAWNAESFTNGSVYEYEPVMAASTFSLDDGVAVASDNDSLGSLSVQDFCQSFPVTNYGIVSYYLDHISSPVALDLDYYPPAYMSDTLSYSTSVVPEDMSFSRQAAGNVVIPSFSNGDFQYALGFFVGNVISGASYDYFSCSFSYSLDLSSLGTFYSFGFTGQLANRISYSGDLANSNSCGFTSIDVSVNGTLISSLSPYKTSNGFNYFDLASIVYSAGVPITDITMTFHSYSYSPDSDFGIRVAGSPGSSYGLRAIYSFSQQTVDDAFLVVLRDYPFLDDANDQAQDSINQHEQYESEWTGSMTENFNALDMESFSFPDGLVSAFALITGIFNDLWNALGEYKILFVFPLCLGIVLLLIGRISKFDFSDRSGGSGGSGPPAVI